LNLFIKIQKFLFAVILFNLMMVGAAGQVDTSGIKPLVPDSTKGRVKGYLDAPITYPARDSTVYSLSDNKIRMYGEAKVTYQQVELTADYIEISIDRKEVFAVGLMDSTGMITGKPVFKDGEESYECTEIRYNFDTKKAFVKDVRMKQEEGFLHSHLTKRDSSGSLNIKDGKFTTCDADDPHFFFAITKGKVIPKKVVVSGPAYLVVEGIPLYPIGLPFAFFPEQQKRSSGILMPKYGEERNRGFYLREGGYYFAINDRLDLSLTGGIYSRGSWQLGAQTNYRKIYKFNGNFSFNYANNVTGEKGLDNYTKQKDFSLRWSHAQDAKAHPYNSFNASVNFSTSSYDKNNTYSTYQDPLEHLTNQKTSSITYSRKFPNKLFNFTTKIGHSQNSNDSTVVLNFPSGSFTVGRFYPFRFGSSGGRQKWYEKIEMRYTASFENRIKSREDSLFSPDLNFSRDILSKMRNGFKHEIPLSASFKPIKDMTLTPSLNYIGVMYFSYLEKNWDASTDSIIINRINKINYVQALSPNLNLSYTPRMYVYYDFKKGKVKTIRHMMSPSLSFSFRPDLGYDMGKYSRTLVIADENEKGDLVMDEQTYSIFGEGIYGLPSVAGRYGNISFSLGNNVEMKIKDPADSTGSKDKKVKLLESLTLNTSYDIFKDSLNLSPIQLQARTIVMGQFNLSFRSVFNPYAIDSTIRNNTAVYRTINTFEIMRSGKPFRLTDADFSLGFTLPLKKQQGGRQGPSQARPVSSQDSPSDFQTRWNLRVDYNFKYSKPYMKSTITQSLRMSGDLNLTQKWSVNFSSGYDFINQEFTYTTFGLRRDLHCWLMSIDIVPFGERKSYTFSIAAKGSLLKDVKYLKQKDWRDN